MIKLPAAMVALFAFVPVSHAATVVSAIELYGSHEAYAAINAPWTGRPSDFKQSPLLFSQFVIATPTKPLAQDVLSTHLEGPNGTYADSSLTLRSEISSPTTGSATWTVAADVKEGDYEIWSNTPSYSVYSNITVSSDRAFKFQYELSHVTSEIIPATYNYLELHSLENDVDGLTQTIFSESLSGSITRQYVLPAGEYSIWLNRFWGGNIELVSQGENTERLSVFVQAVPETSTWAMMIMSFGAIGFVMRRRRKLALAA